MVRAEETTQVSISPGPCCFSQLTWECTVSPSRAMATLFSSLLSQGFRDESHSEIVRELVHPDEHRVVLVPLTGRVQLRLHYLTPKKQRAAKAGEFARLLSEIFNVE